MCQQTTLPEIEGLQCSDRLENRGLVIITIYLNVPKDVRFAVFELGGSVARFAEERKEEKKSKFDLVKQP